MRGGPDMAGSYGLSFLSIKPDIKIEFIRLVKEKSNYSMLINCASANRVGAFMMIFRVLEQGGPEETALEEAVKIGLKRDELKKFARDHFAKHKPKRS